MDVLTPASVYRRYFTEGVPDSGEHNPDKAEIIQLLERMEQSAGAGLVVRQTKAALEAVTPPPFVERRRYRQRHHREYRCGPRPVQCADDCSAVPNRHQHLADGNARAQWRGC